MLTQVWNKPNLSGRITLVFKTELALNRAETVLQQSALIYPSTSNCTVFPSMNLGLKKINNYSLLFQKDTTCFNLILRNALFTSMEKTHPFQLRDISTEDISHSALSSVLGMLRASCSAVIPQQRPLPYRRIFQGQGAGSSIPWTPELGTSSCPNAAFWPPSLPFFKVNWERFSSGTQRYKKAV